jgi:hypothetical protein
VWAGTNKAPNIFLGAFTGSQFIPGLDLPELTVVGGQFVLNFVSDPTVERLGFEAVWGIARNAASAPPTTAAPTWSPTTYDLRTVVPAYLAPGIARQPPMPSLVYPVYDSAQATRCSGMIWLRKTSGWITDRSEQRDSRVKAGGLLASYEPRMSCIFRIRVDAPVVLGFTSFSTEMGFDVLQVFDEGYPSILLGSFSGSDSPPLLLATSGNMTISFRSDDSLESSGWTSFYSTIPQAVRETAAPTDTPTALPTEFRTWPPSRPFFAGPSLPQILTAAPIAQVVHATY